MKDISKNNAKETKTLYLDYSKWKSGASHNPETLVGTGSTALCNAEGYMCCLGQFAIQLGVKDLGVNRSVPSTLAINHIILLKNKSQNDTKFSEKAITINDNYKLTPAQRILGIRKLLKVKGYKLIVINKPK